MRIPIVGAVVLMIAATCANADTDCALAESYYTQSLKAIGDDNQRGALELLERAVAVCPTYQYFQELGEAAAAFGESQLNARAAEAYVSAYALATGPTEQARSIGRYAELLYHTNDPQKALSYIHEAKNLDPDSPWIAALAKQIDERSMNVTSADIKRGLGNMAFKPLKLQHSVEIAEGKSGGSGNIQTMPDSRVDPGVEQRVESPIDQRAINIPMNFEFNSTHLDRWTAKNIDVLASTLAEVDFAGKQFVFVGHADQRGSAEANMVLSTQRALAIYNAVVALQPSLAGRISTQGRGAEQPLSLGTTDADYRVNRRLEVILR